MDLNLTKWTKDWALMSRFFKANEISLITGRLKKLKIQNVVFCSFENRFAKSGGLAAVTTNILPYLKEAKKIPNVILMTPFYPNIMDITKLKPTGKFFSIPFNNKKIQVDLFEYTWNYTKPVNGDVTEYYLKADGFFQSGNRLKDPYLYTEENSRLNDNAMRESALFFCKAVPLALDILNIRENIVFHLQEWQTALIALTSKAAMLNNTLVSCGTAQTMHNSYDSFITFELLSRITDGISRNKISSVPGNGLTAYQIGLQLTDAPVTTVSEHFAEELTADILQTDYFAPHLQAIFRKSGVYGVDNGAFIDLAPDYPKKEKTSLDELIKIKLQKRKALLKILSAYKPKECIGGLTYKGKTISKLPDNIPIILMSGRYDPMQKGYDILLRAIEKFSEDEIKVIMTPLTFRNSDLDYFYEVACKCKGNLIVYPFRIEKGYNELQTGATFGVMPSIYEPFGAAVEYMANGTVNIGRATGGLLDQIDAECGFLYKENAVFYTLDNIRSFVETGDIVQMRKSNPWVQNMADNLYEVLKKAVYVYQYQQNDYYKLVLNGFKRVSSFTWEKNAGKYYEVYGKIAKI
jgi:glycogen synthase